MGVAFLYGNGGGGKRGEIIVTAPTGTTVTCSKGGKVKTAAEENGVWTFKNLEYGTWTVSGELDGDTVSIPVDVGAENVLVEFKTWLYKDGDLMGYTWTGAALGYNDVKRAPTIANGKTSLSISGYAQQWAEGVAYITQPIDLTDRKTLGIEIAANSGGERLLIWKGVPTSMSSAYWESLSGLTAEIDVSGLSGEHYIGIYLNNRSGTSSNVEIQKMYLSGGSGGGSSGGGGSGGTTELPRAEEASF